MMTLLYRVKPQQFFFHCLYCQIMVVLEAVLLCLISRQTKKTRDALVFSGSCFSSHIKHEYNTHFEWIFR